MCTKITNILELENLIKGKAFKYKDTILYFPNRDIDEKLICIVVIKGVKLQLKYHLICNSSGTSIILSNDIGGLQLYSKEIVYEELTEISVKEFGEQLLKLKNK